MLALTYVRYSLGLSIEQGVDLLTSQNVHHIYLHSPEINLLKPVYKVSLLTLGILSQYGNQLLILLILYYFLLGISPWQLISFACGGIIFN